MVVVDMELGDVIALDAFAHGEPVKAEYSEQILRGRLITNRNIDPDMASDL